MEVVTFLSLIVILVLLINFRNTFFSRIEDLSDGLLEMQKKLDELLSTQNKEAVIPTKLKDESQTKHSSPKSQETFTNPFVAKPAQEKDVWQSAFKRMDEPSESSKSSTEIFEDVKESIPQVEMTNAASSKPSFSNDTPIWKNLSAKTL